MLARLRSLSVPGFVLTLILMTIPAPRAQAQGPVPRQAPSAPAARAGVVLVKLSPAAASGLRAAAPQGLARMRAVSPAAARLVTALNSTSMEPTVRTEWIFPAAIGTGLDRWYSLAVDPAADVNALVARARTVAGVEIAEPNGVRVSSVAPNDSLFSKNWGHGNTGTFPSYAGSAHTGPNVGTIGFDSNIQSGWGSPAGYGSASVIIAILDTGVDPTHPDLRQVPGYDIVNGDPIPEDTHGHGTACAGVAAGIANNANGAAGAAGGCSIMAVRTAIVNNALDDIANGVAYAASHGARIISMSFGGPSHSQLELDAINAAYAAGVVLFACTQNQNAPSIAYPAAYRNVIAVGAASPCGSRKRSASSGTVGSGVLHDSLGVSCDNETWWGSNWGVAIKDDSAAVDIVGPSILPTTDIQGAGGFSSDGYYDWFNGTSCATPYVAGVAALLISQHPTWTPAQVRQRLMETAIDIVDAQTPAGWDKYTGYGMVNAALPDVIPYLPAGWAKPIVPRPTADGTVGSVPAPTVLNGDGSTYISAAMACLGEARSGVGYGSLAIDGATTAFSSYDMPAGTGAITLNVPHTIPGGRHVLGHYLDPTNNLTESNENNNNDAHQWVWQPAALALNQQMLRPIPPDPVGGTSSIPAGETFYMNQDGVRASAPPGGTIGYWVVGLRNQGGDLSDSDLRLYRPSTGATNGFVPTSAIAFSGLGGGITDFAWWKLGSPNQPTSMDVGMAQGDPFLVHLNGVMVENRASQLGLTFNGSSAMLQNQTIAAEQVIAAHYLDVQSAGAGSVTIVLTTNLPNGSLGTGLHVALLSPADTAGSRNQALGFSSTVAGVERLSRTLTAGLYGIVVYRDTGFDGNWANSGLYTLKVLRTPTVELVAGGAAGWYAPSLPYKQGVGNTSSAPTVLDGNVNNTIFAYSYTNSGSTTASGFNANEYIDGSLILGWTPGALVAGGNAQWNSTPRNIRGGLHTVGFANDVTNAIDEFNEGNNNHASQWVWSPLPMSLGVPVTRPGLPDPQGGWSDIPVGVTRYPNVDGLRSPQFQESGTFDGMWGAVALTPSDAATNPDLRISALLSSGPSDGFRTADEISARSGDSTDVVVVDVDNQPKTVDVGLYKSAGTASVKVHAVSSIALLGINHSNTYGPFSLGPDSLVALFNFPFATTYNGMTINLQNDSGNANLDFMLFDRTDPTRLYNPGQAVATAAQSGNGGNELYSGSIPAYAGLVVLKVGSADVAKKAMFRLVVSDATVGVDDDAPIRIAFAPITPNPARADAVMRFDLPREMAVDLAVYDIGGRRVSTLANGAWNAGRHAVHWTTMGNEGRPVPNGVYFVRFSAGDYQATQRVLVVR